MNMKTMKFLIGMIAAALITSAASAQHSSSPRGKVNLGIKAGINMYKISSDDNTIYDQITGFNLGLLGHIHFDSQWAVQPELVYSSQGAKIGGSDQKLDYINIPVIFQYMFDNGFRLQAGPQLGLLVRADNKDDLNPIDLGVGIGVSYVVPSTGFGVDARYNFGLSNINKNDAVKAFNRGVQLGVFYIFGHNTRELLQ
jgi:opacity protein-like surface antigen